ncbi:MAG TPA: hypothetical protein DIV86_01625 [Alphaproteobacteria bacterium]|nr:hypothetical protein [Alphaproteobacteria bacterium]
MKRQESLQSQSLILPVFAAVSVVIFIALCWYAYNNFIAGTKSGSAVYIKADNSPFKVKPSEPGGMKIAHKDKQIFNTITGENEDLKTGIKVINEESPISKEKIISQATSNNSKSIIDETGKEAEILLKNAKTKELHPKDASEGDIILAQKNGDIEKLKEMKPLGKASEKSTAKEKPVVETSKNESGENKTKIVFSTPKSAVKPAASTGASGAFYVQIGAYASNTEAQNAWTTHVKKLGTLVSGSTKRITTAVVNGKTFYRLSFGAFKSRAEATAKCAQLKAKNVSCLVQN